MECIELLVPPMPQPITVGHAVWTPGMKHAERCFDVYDWIFVRRGCFPITENGHAYELEEGEAILLEPGRTHYGHRPVESATEVYWFHFIHSGSARSVDSDSIQWSSLLRKGKDDDVKPVEQYMYLPKRAYIGTGSVSPVLESMVELHGSLTLRNALRMQASAAELFVRLQDALRPKLETRAFRVSELAIDYLRRRMREPFRSSEMEHELLYSFDYISRCLKQYTGLSPLQYMHRLQIDEAQSLLRLTDWSMQEIGERIGQPNVHYFIRLFRKHLGVTPGVYRASKHGRL
jgi:AraC-like DNA-binding protein